jgi:Nucleotidyltransferase domain
LTVAGIAPVIELAEHLARIVEVIIGWAKVHQDIRGVALVGSHARGTAGLDSDIDLDKRNPRGKRCSLLTRKPFVLMAHGSKPSIGRAPA